MRVNITNGIEKPPKTKQGLRSVELNQDAYSALKSMKSSKWSGEFRVFLDPRTKSDFKNADSLRKYVWKPALEKANVNYRYPYQTRHTFASQMLSKGKNPMWVASQMGHADWGMIRSVYGRWIN